MGMGSESYVRTDMLSEQTAPPSEVGIIGWLRANLFSTWLNGTLTILAILAIFFVLEEILPWVFQSSWTATSLAECRAAISAAYGEGTTGACWAVIRERYLQLIYGFYPTENRMLATIFASDLLRDAGGIDAVFGADASSGVTNEFVANMKGQLNFFVLMVLGYWRQNLTFVLMLVAVAPVLFNKLPRKMLWFSAVYPALGFWLSWGGSIWGPLMVLAGFALGYGAFVFFSRISSSLAALIAAGLTPIIWWLFLAAPVAGVLHSIIPLGIEAVPSSRFGGFMLSIIIGITGIAGSLPLGIILALGRQSNLMIVKTLCVGFIEFIRGVPLITLLFVASVLLNYFLPPGTSFDLILRVVIMVTLFASAYMAEVVRGGLAALPLGQYEASDALGLDYWKSMRLIILPQALKVSIPGIVSSFIGLFKDTTLVSIIGLLDPLGLSSAIRANQAWNGIIWELYGFIALMFFIFCFSMSRYSMYLERKLQTGH